MSGQLKNSLVLLASVAITLSACNRVNVESRNIEGNRSELTPQETTPVKSPSPLVTPSPILSQDKSEIKTSSASVKVNRENYKPIALTQLTKNEALTGEEPKAIALAAFGDVDSEGGSRDVKVEYPQPDRAVVIITQTGVADDSVRAIRYRAELVPTSKSQTGKQWKIVWAGSQFTCQRGRGHQDWSIKLCS
ncbi:hypothetical protein [Allocoleopsis franciscana]|uniref:Lipoprotein n=1 Tax=Allocoleopsis franciscana PCC 7113 TaxID=1173027 RepID=K9WGL6_9CYAN|nr:hypothetical protein [Allocoleopsis franciscana]AFZ18929.1 hypothetical protein Mic7113_3189 [Allocoleopsis franciscana PCC 7113]